MKEQINAAALLSSSEIPATFADQYIIKRINVGNLLMRPCIIYLKDRMPHQVLTRLKERLLNNAD